MDVKAKQKTNEFDYVRLRQSELGLYSLFGGVSPLQLTMLEPYLESRQYAPGDKIFLQGDLPSEIFILIQGEIDLVVEQAGVYRIEASYERGDTFGETAFIGIQPQVGTAIVSAGEPVLTLSFTRESLFQLNQESSELFGLLMMNVAREVSRKIHHMLASVH